MFLWHQVTENSLIKGPNSLGASLSEHGNSWVLKHFASLKKFVYEQSPLLKKKKWGEEGRGRVREGQQILVITYSLVWT
jgi:hypothetical protein